MQECKGDPKKLTKTYTRKKKHTRNIRELRVRRHEGMLINTEARTQIFRLDIKTET